MAADWAALGLLALLAGLLLAPALFGGQVLYYRDVAIDFLPQTAFLYNSVAAGHFPIWNPLTAGGYPQLASLQPPYFYPLQGVFLAPAWGWGSWAGALAGYQMLHYALAGWLAYALARRWGMVVPAALAAGVAYELSGYMASLSNLYTNLPAAALLPLVVLLADRLLADPSARALALASLAMALQIACGRPDVALLASLLLAGLAVWRARAARGGYVRRLAAVGALLALAAAANGATLLPAMEFVAHSSRAGGIPVAEAVQHSFAPSRLAELAWPAWLAGGCCPPHPRPLPGGEGVAKELTLSGEENRIAPYFLTLYGGLFACLLALLARSPAGTSGLVPFLWTVWGLSLLLALGSWTPFYDLFLYFPGATYVRYPSKFFLLWSFSLALLAGLGAARLASWRRGLAWAAALLVAADLLASNRAAIDYASPELYRQPPPAAAYMVERDGVPPPRFIRPYGNDVALGGTARPVSPLESTRQALRTLAYNTNLYHEVPTASGYGSLEPMLSPVSLLAALFPDGPRAANLEGYARIAGASNVGYLLFHALDGPPPVASPALSPAVLDSAGAYLYRNRHALPRAFFVPAALVVPDVAAAVRAVAVEAGRLDRQVVLLNDAGLQATLPLRETLPRRAPVARFCRVLAYEPNRVSIESSSPESGYLVLADNHYPGWMATVDGEPRPILQANAVSRAVYVQAGRHLIEFNYWPRPFAAGLALSLLSLAALAMLAGPLSHRLGRHQF